MDDNKVELLGALTAGAITVQKLKDWFGGAGWVVMDVVKWSCCGH